LEAFDVNFNINVLGPILKPPKAALKLFGDKGGTISLGASKMPLPAGSLYSATKAALDALKIAYLERIRSTKHSYQGNRDFRIMLHMLHVPGFKRSPLSKFFLERMRKMRRAFKAQLQIDGRWFLMRLLDQCMASLRRLSRSHWRSVMQKVL
jgi:hypothetical protein